MPATTVLNGSGAFVKDVFPFATETIVSSAVASGKAIIGIPEEYSLLAGETRMVLSNFQTIINSLKTREHTRLNSMLPEERMTTLASYFLTYLNLKNSMFLSRIWQRRQQ